MAWARLDDQFPDHPKVIAAGPLAKALFVDALCYCNRLLTDGFIPKRMALRLAADYAEYTDNDLVARLVDVGLWDLHPDGFMVHDFLDYQPSAEKVKAERAKTAKRQADYRDRHSGNRNGVSNAVSNAGRSSDVTRDGHGDDPADGDSTDDFYASQAQRNAVTNDPVTGAPSRTRPTTTHTHRARENGETLAEVNGDTTPVMALFAAYATGAGIAKDSSEFLTRQKADLPSLRDAAHAGLDPPRLERMARYVASTWRAKGIAVTPKVEKVLAAESEFDRWEADGRPDVTDRSTPPRSPTPLRSVPTRDNVITGDGTHVPF